ncbi:MAG: cyclic nucleotide-binding domain-containing protein [Alphaproteobacteria bacterium]
MRDEDLRSVRGLRLFADMADAHFADLMRVAYLQSFPPQVQLIAEGEPADFLHVVVAGAVELFACANNRETTMATVRPVSTFILAAVLKDAAYLMSARTLEKSRVLLIPSDNIRAVMDVDPAFNRAIIVELASCYRAVVKAQKDLKLRTGVERLANYLLRHHAAQGGNGTVALQIEKRVLAGQLGMTPENLSRAFGTLKPYGVEVDGAQITLTALADLEGLAKPNPLIDDPSI